MKYLLPLFCLFAAISSAEVQIVLVGDSTVNDQGGWGKGFSGASVAAIFARRVYRLRDG